ncbi:MAG: hypothetical protein WC320_01405 [Candidatus Paceibacterota bacterium]|jgi:hypothetical protein
MKNKILVAGVLVTILAFAGTAYTLGQNINAGTNIGNQAQQQTQAANQAENSQIQTQNNEQIQGGIVNQSEVETQTQNQNQEQTQNQGEEIQIQNQEQERTQTQTQSVQAEQRRSQVANAVQEMLQVAERNGGIGQQVRTIAQNQNQNQEKIEASLQKVQSRSGFARFFIGPNYGEIKNAQKLLEQNREQIKQLNQIKNQLSNQGDMQILTQKIQVLEQTNLQIENFLQNAQKEFSLFGWIFRLFVK